MNPSTLDHSISEQPVAVSTVTLEVTPSPPARWATRLRRHLTIAFVAKLALLALLYFLFFSPSQRPHIDAADVADRFLSPG